MHLLLAGLLVGLLARLGVRLPARFGGSAIRIPRHLAVVAIVVTLLVAIAQIDLGGLGEGLIQTLRAMHGG